MTKDAEEKKEKIYAKLSTLLSSSQSAITQITNRFGTMTPYIVDMDNADEEN